MRALQDLLERFPALKNLRLRRVEPRIPVVRQLAATDCGAAALGMAIRFHGRDAAMDDVRQALGASRDGINAAALLRVARAFGLKGRGVHVDMEALGDLPRGAILYWQFRHFVVFDRVGKGVVAIVDPASGRRSVPIEKFRRAFTGVALVFEPSDTLFQTHDKTPRHSTLLQQVLEHRDLFTRVAVVSLLVQAFSAAAPLLTGVVIDRVVPRRDYSLLLVLTAAFCAVQVFQLFAGFVRSHLLIHLRTQMELRFTLRFLDHLVDLPYAFFQHHTSGDLMIRLGSNNTVKEILTSTALSAVLDGTMSGIYLILLVLASPTLAAVVLVLALTRVVLLYAMRSRQRHLVAESLENRARAQTYEVEMLSGMETLKAMGVEHSAAENWSNLFVQNLNISIKMGRLDAVFNLLLNALGGMTTLVFLFYGTYLVLNGGFTLGSMMAFSALASGFLGPMSSLASAAMQFQMVEVYLERLNDVMNAAPEQDRRLSGVVEPLVGGIVLDNVSFQYGKEQPLVLHDVSMTVSPGSRIVIVGRSGSGKSTLARLLAGLYEPTSGRIMLDERDLQNIDRRSIRSQLGIVTQEVQLFSGSIRHNIALADREMPLDRIVTAARLAALHDEIIAMPMGYETLLVDRGLSLSGGQRQRLALARALARRPRILILDEATSHLDALTEELVNRNLASLKCTRVVIAHRLSTIRDADLILVLDAGRVVEAGRHDQLLKADGVYASLCRAQRDGEVAASV